MRLRGLAVVAVLLAMAWASPWAAISVQLHRGQRARTPVVFDTSDLDAWLKLAVLAGVLQIAFANLAFADSAGSWRARIVPLGWLVSWWAVVSPG